MNYFYEYRRLPFCDPQEVCEELMDYEDRDYEIFKLELQPNGKEYLVYLRKPRVIENATYFIKESAKFGKYTNIEFEKHDLFLGLPDGMLRHIRSGIEFKFTMKWKDLILIM